MYYYFKANGKRAKNANDNVHFSISGSNKKLTPNDDVKFLIWNIPAVITCPYRTKLCEKICYAKGGEMAYPTALPSRMRNFDACKRADFVELMVEAIHYICNLSKYKEAKQINYRIHESGDFYNQEYTDKWLEIARQCADIPNLVFTAYTKSFKFFINVNRPNNFILILSLMADTSADQLALMDVLKADCPIYTACTKDQLDGYLSNGAQLCECENCATCGKCYNRDTKGMIVVLIH